MGQVDQKNALGWLGIVRLGLVQTALGAIVVLTTSTLNRVMVVELALPAMLPGALVGWHYGVQMLRPRFGYGADLGGRRRPWILGGMFILAWGGFGAAMSTALMEEMRIVGVIGAAISFFLIGAGVGAAGTNLLALLAIRVAPDRKPAAAAIVWIMMIVGFVMTAAISGQLLDPFSMNRLVMIAGSIGAIAFALAFVATLGIERTAAIAQRTEATPAKFVAALGEVWSERQARRFAIFVFVAMLAYSAQDLILEPFAGLIYGMTPGQSTKLSGVQNGGVLIGMILTAIVGTTIGRSRAGFMRAWTVAGCLASALALAGLAAAASVGPSWPLPPSVFALGLANGAFAVAAIGSMMTLASAGRPGREGTRMGVWGAAQAVAFGLGGFLGAVALDGARAAFGAASPAFAAVFAVEGAIFLVAAALALRVGRSAADDIRLPAMPADALPAE